ncbi:MAG: PAS domain S-box protein [Spirochaetes bacterium]|nr:PAS domain S-box protein [Spirochaetota bacterium]
MQEPHKNLLLLDDDHFYINSLIPQLKKKGYQIFSETSIKKAIANSKNQSKIDLILTSNSFCQNVKNLKAINKVLQLQEIPIILIIAPSEDDTFLQTRGMPVYGYIERSSGILTIEASIKMAIKQFQLDQQNKIQIIKYTQLFEQSPFGIAIHDIEGNFTDVNQKFCDILGYTKDELCQLHISQILLPTPDTKLKDQEAKKSLLKNGYIQFENSHITKSGARIEGEITARVIEFKNSKFIQSVFKDITSQKLTEQAYQKEKDLAKKYLDIASVIIIAINNAGYITLVNNKGCQILGFPQSELLGKHWFDTFIPGKTRDQVKKVFSQLMAGQIEPVEYFENPIINKNKEIKVIAWHNTILKDQQGKIIGTLSSGEDITEKKQKERQFQSIFEMSLDLICIADINTTTFKRVSPSFTQTLGYTEDELLSCSFLDFIHPDDIQPTIDLIENELKKGIKVLRFTNRYRTKQGNYLFLNWSSHPVPEEGITYSIAHDITERVHNEEEIQSLLKEKEILLREVHHRIKNNMSTMKNLLSLQAMKIEEKEAKKALSAAEKRMTAMMLLYDKLYRNKDINSFSIKEYIHTLIDKIVYTFPISVLVKKEIAEIPLPIQTASTLGIIINELISNSMKYAFQQNGNHVLEISLVSEKKQVKLSVQDNGQGFEVNKDTYGFGLTIVNALTQQLSGNIEIVNKNGTQCIITFPYDQS